MHGVIFAAAVILTIRDYCLTRSVCVLQLQESELHPNNRKVTNASSIADICGVGHLRGGGPWKNG
jgi:hypothetical protein